MRMRIQLITFMRIQIQRIIDVDPDPTFHFDAKADPDPSFQIEA